MMQIKPILIKVIEGLMDNGMISGDFIVSDGCFDSLTHREINQGLHL